MRSARLNISKTAPRNCWSSPAIQQPRWRCPPAHFPFLACTCQRLVKPLLPRVAPPHVTIVDSAESTAQFVAEKLGYAPVQTSTEEERRNLPRLKFFATDSVEKFRRLGERFLGHPIKDVQHVDLTE